MCNFASRKYQIHYNMKKILVLLLSVIGIAAYADDYTYPYLVFIDNSGNATTLNVSELKITFENGQLVAQNSDEKRTFNLSELSVMQFAETGTATGIDTITTTVDSSQPIEVYSSSGILMGRYNSISEASQQLQRGVYIARQNEVTSKFTVK